MTPAELIYWQRVNLRAANLTPEVARAILRAFQSLRDSLTESELARLVSSNRIDQLFETKLSQARIDAAFQPIRDTMRKGVIQGVKYFQRDVPKKPNVSVSFDLLNPDVVTAVRKMETEVITDLDDSVKETVRASVENGLRDGRAPSAVAREIRGVIGLASSQEQAVRNFRTLLETGDRDALKRALRDRRFDTTLDRVLGANGEGLKASQVDRMVDSYRQKSLAHNAHTVARTAATDAYKLGQRLSIDSAVEQGIYNPDRLMKTWIGIMDTRERPEHVDMQGETVPYDEPFSNGEMQPGDSTYNCRCIPRYHQ